MRDRIVDLDWSHYDYKWAVFEPAHMSRQDLMGGLEWINKRFYSPWRILRRLCRWLTMPSGLANFHVPLLLNVAYWGRQFRFRVKGYNPARRTASSHVTGSPVRWAGDPIGTGPTTAARRRPGGREWKLEA
jgi:hypothetical protein